MPVGTLVNAVAILVGGVLGTLLHARFPKPIQSIIFHALGLATLLIGMRMALEGENILIIVFSLICGAIAGEALRLESRLERWGERLKARTRTRDGRFTEGFVAATLLFCIGAMAIIGSLEDGIRQDRTLLYTKSILDGCTSIALGATYGIGVVFSALPLLLYQGTITLFAGAFKPLASDFMMQHLTAVGGLLIFGIGLRLLDIARLRLANFLPALLFAVLFVLTAHTWALPGP